MARVVFYIDGFNLYHVIDRFCPKAKWLDLKKMAQSVLSSKDHLEKVHYFSAYAYWIPRREERHRLYVNALKSQGVSVLMGRFKSKHRKCPVCKKPFVGHEEKQTDVNIALKIFEDAVADKFDTAILVSGDTDFLPVIATVKRLTDKRIGVMLPIGAKAKSLKDAADFGIKMKKKHLALNQLPKSIETPQGFIQIPKEWE